MLIDQLFNMGIENVAPAGLAPLRARLGRAHKFCLAPDFAAAAEELAVDLKTVANALPHCRLPYPLTWIEVAQQHRPRFMTAGVHMPGIQSVPTRVGFLLEANDAKLSGFSAYQFWELEQLADWPQASHVSMLFDPVRFAGSVLPEEIDNIMDRGHRLLESTGLVKDNQVPASPEWLTASPEVRARITSAVMPSIAPFADCSMLEGTDPNDLDETKIAALLLEIGMLDWSGEAIYLLAVLALLNTLNATEATRTDFSKLNKLRVKAKKPPLAEHYVLKIHPAPEAPRGGRQRRARTPRAARPHGTGALQGASHRNLFLAAACARGGEARRQDLPCGMSQRTYMSSSAAVAQTGE